MASTPRDENHVPGLVAKSDADSTTIVLEADPATKRLKVNATITGGGASGTQYTDGDVAVTHPVGAIPVYNNAGTITAVSVANPLPVSATISTAGLATSTKQSDGTQKTQVVDATGNVIGATSNALDVNIKSGNLTTLPVTNAGTFLVQATEADGSNVTLGAKADAKNTATDTTAVTIMSVLKQISASVQAPPSQAVTNAGTFVVQATLAAETTKVIGTINVAASQTIAVTNTGTFATQPTIQTGTNSIGKISDITTSVVPGTGATNLGKAEDAAHTTGDVGVLSLGVRNDTLADTTNTNADYSQMSTDIKGRVMTAGAPRSLKANTQTSLSNTTSETTIIAATASTFHDVYGIILANTGATTTKVSIRDDTAGTVRTIIEVPTLETRGFMLPVDSAVTQTAVNKNWTAQCASATTALEVTALYVSMV